jgi:hypothetical protein
MGRGQYKIGGAGKVHCCKTKSDYHPIKSTVAQQQRGIAELTPSLKEQVLQIQKVGTQLEMRTSARQTGFKN